MKKLCIAHLLLLLLFSCSSPLSQLESSRNLSSQTLGEAPFSARLNTYADRALAYELGRSGASSSRSLVNIATLTLAEKKDLLFSTIEKNRGSRGTLSSADEEFYSALSEEIKGELDGTVFVSSSLFEVDDELLTTTVFPFMQEIEGVSYSKPQLLALAEEALIAQAAGQRGLVKVDTWKWGRNIEYRVEAGVSDRAIEIIEAAMDEWEAHANNRFAFNSIENNGWNQFVWWMGWSWHLAISNASDPNIGGQATLGAGPWRFFHIGQPTAQTARHELGHVLGLEHEQNRFDRDDFITINWNNIKDNSSEWWNRDKYKSQFTKIQRGFDNYLNVFVDLWFWRGWIPIYLGYKEVSRAYGVFDFQSIMMYGSYAFSRSPGVLATMTRRDGTTFFAPLTISAQDVATIRVLYP